MQLLGPAGQREPGLLDARHGDRAAQPRATGDNGDAELFSLETPDTSVSASRPWYTNGYVWAGGVAVATGATIATVTLMSYLNYRAWCEALCPAGNCPTVEISGNHAERCRATLGVVMQSRF